MPHRPSTSAARQCLRLKHLQAPSRMQLSSLKALNQSLSGTSNSKAFTCLFSPHALNCRPSMPRRCFSDPRPALLRLSPSSSRVETLYSTSPPSAAPKSLSAEQFHELADSYIDSLLVHLEQLQEERADVDCEYSVRTPFIKPSSSPDLLRSTSPAGMNHRQAF